jgi:purine nucleoside permease
MSPRTVCIVLFLPVLLGPALPDEANVFIPPTVDHPLKVKVVILAMFEVGADTGDAPGEFQFWVERRKLDHVIPLPSAYHDVHAAENGLIGTITGMGTAKAATSTMALGLDPRFGFSQAYWLVAGIAGIDPDRGTVGSAVWADYVLEGDLAHEIDAWKRLFLLATLLPQNCSTIGIHTRRKFPAQNWTLRQVRNPTESRLRRCDRDHIRISNKVPQLP